MTKEVGALFGHDPRYKGKAQFLDLTIMIPCISANLENAAQQTRKYLADEAERKKDNY